jgi:anthranilate synthase component I
MKITTFEEYNSCYHKGNMLPVCVEILADMDTPVSTFLKTTSGSYRYLLESVESGANRGRYSIIGDTPLMVFKSKNGSSLLLDEQKHTWQTHQGEPFSCLKALVGKYRIPKELDALGGFFGYFGYDIVKYIERLPNVAQDDLELPDILLFVPQRIVIFDNLLNKLKLVELIPSSGNPKNDYERAVNSLQDRIARLRSGTVKNEVRQEDKPSSGQMQSNLSQSDFECIVDQAKKYVERGDIFQVVLSQRFQKETTAKPFDIYRALRVINPSPYMFYMDLDGLTVLGSSPETLVKKEGRKITVKPIAGTRKRGASEKEDQALIADLLSDPKEKAEHTMLVDLGRNDIGRVAEFSTVQVEEFMSIEKYSHVIHIVSTVTGMLKPEFDAIDVFKAAFPAGTVSGAPKVRAMEIIEELEPTRRSIYAGAVGYFAFNGDLDVCIAIRMIYIRNGIAFVQAGAGIVADSQPEKEFEETLNKARGLLAAIEQAEGGLQ